MKGKKMRRSKDALEIVAKFRLGSETRDSKFWKKEEEKCRLCMKELEGMEHIMKRYEYMGIDEP